MRFTMVIGENFVWCHLPKTGGTTMNRIFKQYENYGVVIDDDRSDTKHDSIPLREARTNSKIYTNRRYINIRRLTSWLISDWHHKRRHMNLPFLSIEPVKSGLFFSLRLGGTWVAADWWLQYFNVDEECRVLRLEHLVDDFNDFLLPCFPDSAPRLVNIPRENAKPEQTSGHTEMFNDIDLKRIYAANPRWRQLEATLYN